MTLTVTFKCESGGEAQQLAAYFDRHGYEPLPLTECERDEVVIRADRVDMTCAATLLSLLSRHVRFVAEEGC